MESLAPRWAPGAVEESEGGESSSGEDTGRVPQESTFSKEEVASATRKEEIAAAISAVDGDCRLEGERNCGRKQWGEAWLQSYGPK